MTSSGTRAGIELVKRLVADRVKRGGFDKLFLEKVIFLITVISCIVLTGKLATKYRFISRLE